MKNIILIIAVILCTVSAKSQQNPQYTQYVYNMNVINPAYAGSLDGLTLNFLARTQWVGIDGAPQTITVGAHKALRNNLGLGLSVIVDKIGPVQEQNIYADISYTIDLNNNSKLAFGLKGGVTAFNLCMSCLNSTDPETSEFLNRSANKTLPNIGAGLFYYTDSFYLGFAMPNLLETYHFEKTGNQVTNGSEKTHYFLNTGYVFDVSRNVKLKPSIMVKGTQGAPLSVDFSANALVNEKVEFGLSYRLSESLSALINIKARDNLRIGYAYDHTLTSLGDFNSGSHEIFLLFNINSERNRIKSPRFF
ncbi:type IX secretion system membrane protein PorP/SprF [Polaribacter vadi]|uniref:PorP/SprF family type IX secretion system membrane protein n=1 Tax=Polaribacter TaxID=52959 RepID=UPI001C08D2E5|nr:MULTISPECIES: type IX secretion system membrane protein PorP/SprF [Polaribacter]MBU3011660.1 type IX secretion system membrane protein PorP/SprF [Polaribacter vadi]MDO6741473.1 type IX secretion system membrane protein PorP/SprF [Polaribacter sp. 1_MG-2023]